MSLSSRSGQRSGVDRRKQKERREEESTAYLEEDGAEKRSGMERRKEPRRKEWGDWTRDWSAPLKRSR